MKLKAIYQWVHLSPGSLLQEIPIVGVSTPICVVCILEPFLISAQSLPVNNGARYQPALLARPLHVRGSYHKYLGSGPWMRIT